MSYLPSQVPSASTTSIAGTAKKSASLSVAAPTLAVPALLTAAVSLVTVQTLQDRLEQLISNLQSAGIQT